jgi:hypothetical protein
MFFIALINIQFIATLEIATIAKPLKVASEIEGHFEQLCYYELKQDLIIKNYVTKVKDYVKKFFLEHKVTGEQKNSINFQLFWKAFKEGKYGQIATELAGSEDYVKSYWFHFTSDKTKMTEVEFTKFIGLYYLEGELLVAEKHPTLTEFFPNEHNLYGKVACNVGLAYWTLTVELLHRMFIEFKWTVTTKDITKIEIFTILTNTHTGKCLIIAGKKCKWFTEFIGKIMGFFNMSTGKRQNLNIEETKLAYSTMLFQDLYEPACKQTKFDIKKIIEKTKEIKFE